ncbi:MAG: hypothetical protein NWS43_06515 [Crocinitomicaceae bacterium]|nr:hypothetical protein [Crocinitomicaceae bacterium]
MFSRKLIFPVLFSLFCLSNQLYAQSPSLQLKESKRVITLDNEGSKNNRVEMKSIFTPAGTKKVLTQWTISGTKDKDWTFAKGDEKSDVIEIEFKRVGNYSVSLSVTYSKTKKNKSGEVEEEEFDLSEDRDNFITVTNNLDELTQIHADSNFIKLVKRASDYVVKPRYSNDPTPYIFLAKGFFGMYRKDIKDPMIEDPFEEAITATATAIEKDENGVFKMPIHEMWLTNFQTELLNNGIVYRLEEEKGYPILYSNSDKEKMAEVNGEMLDACDSYASVSKNPIAVKFIEAAIRFQMKDVKTANLIWKTEIPNLINITDLENLTAADKDALRIGIILSAQQLFIRDKNYANARTIAQHVANWFEYDRDFIAFYEKEMESYKNKE